MHRGTVEQLCELCPWVASDLAMDTVVERREEDW